MRVILSVSTSIKLMRMENGLNLLDYGRLRKAGNIVSYTHTGRTVNDAVLYRVFQLDLSETKHLLGHQKCTFKS